MKGDELKNLLHGTVIIAIKLYLRSLIAVLVFVANLAYDIYSICSLGVRYRWKDVIILFWNYASRRSRSLQLDLLRVIISCVFASVQRGQGVIRLVMGSILSRIRPNQINYSCLDENCYLLPSDIPCADDREVCLGNLANEHYPRYNMTGELRPFSNKPHQAQPTGHGSSMKRRNKNYRCRRRNKKVSVPLPLNYDVQQPSNKSSIFEPRKFPELDQKSKSKNDPKIIGTHAPPNEIDSALATTTLSTTSADHCKGAITGREVYSVQKSTETQFDLVREPESVVSPSSSNNDKQNLVAHSDFGERYAGSEWGCAELSSNLGLEDVPQEGRNENIGIENEAGLGIGAKVAWLMECPNNDISSFALGTVQSLYRDNGHWFAVVDFEASQDLEALQCERTENGWAVLRVDELLNVEATVCSQGFEFTDNTMDQLGNYATSTSGHENELAGDQILDENENEGAVSLEDSHAIDVCNIKEACGMRKGIQGRANSCYLDSTLFALFYCTKIFDGPLLAPRDMDDDFVKGAKAYLRNVVNRLRTSNFVSADIMMKFRKRIVHFNPRLIGSYMDAEHFMFILLEKTLKSEHFFTYNSDMSDYMHQIFVPPTSYNSKMSTTQKLFEWSMEYNGELKFKEIPNPALIIQIPRTNGKLVDFDWIVPSLQLDVTNTVNYWEAEPIKRCCVCEETATVTCSLCDKDAVAFCDLCVVKQEANSPIIHDLGHTFTPQTIIMAPTQIKMDLVAVICVAAYHYTAYVKCGQDLLSPWLYFDSNGPEIRQMFDVSKILLDTEKQVNAGDYNNRVPPMMCKRIFTDCHLCIYKSPKPVQSL